MHSNVAVSDNGAEPRFTDSRETASIVFAFPAYIPLPSAPVDTKDKSKTLDHFVSV